MNARRTGIALALAAALAALAPSSSAAGPPPALLRDAADCFVGNVEPADAASVSFKIAGRIARFPRENGERVAAGEILAVLDTREIDCGVAQAEAARELARVGAGFAAVEFERAKSMRNERILPANKFDAAENAFNVANAQLALADANLRLARTNLENSVLVSPFAATLVEKSSEASEFASPGRPVCRLIDLASVKVKFRVPEVGAAKLKPGDLVTVTIPSLGRDFTGRVVEIVPNVDLVNRTFPVTVKVENADGAIMAGMFATGRPGVAVGAAVPAAGPALTGN